jgi:multiple sugar transport system permease protein
VRPIHWRRIRNASVPYLLVAPAFIVLCVILVYPSIYNLWLSLWDWQYINPARASFVGLRNYIDLMSDSYFWRALRFTLRFTLISVSLEFLLGLVSALILAKKSERVRRVAGSALLLPYLIAGSVAGLVWRLLWTYEYGLVNYLLSLVGVKPIQWLGNPLFANIAVIVTQVWRNFPFTTIVLLAGLVSLPREPYEAALVDGASGWQRFRFVTLPLLSPSITIALLFRTIFSIRVFDVIFTLTRGGPGNATLPLGILLYNQTFRFFEGGYAAALSMIILAIGMVFSMFYLRILYRRVDF